MADSFDRHRLLASSILIWSIATVAYGMAGSYLGVAISFGILVAAETLGGPINVSLIGDCYKGEDRVTANLTSFAAGTITSGCNALIGGFLLQWSASHFSSASALLPITMYWQLALIIIALFGVPLALASLSLGKDRRAPKVVQPAEKSGIQEYWADHRKTFLPFCLSNAGFGIAAFAVMGWVPIYIVRHFGLSPAELGIRMGTTILVADLFGIAIGLMVIKALYRRFGPIAPRLIFQYSLLPNIALILTLPLARSAWEVLLILGAMNLIATFGTACSNSMLQDITPSIGRGKMYGIYVLIASIITLPGPFLVGVFSDYFQKDPLGIVWSIMLVALPAMMISFWSYAVSNKSYLMTVKAIANEEVPRRVDAE